LLTLHNALLAELTEGLIC